MAFALFLFCSEFLKKVVFHLILKAFFLIFDANDKRCLARCNMFFKE